MTQSLNQLRRDRRVYCINYIESENAVEIVLNKGWTFDPHDDNRIKIVDNIAEANDAVKYRARPFSGPYTE